MMTTRSLNSVDRMMTLNRVFDQALGASLNSRAWVPALDVAERRDAYVMHAELPGVNPEQVEIQFEQNVLSIRGSKPAGFDASAEGAEDPDQDGSLGTSRTADQRDLRRARAPA